MFKLFSILLTLTSFSVISAEKHDTVPVEFQGMWVSEFKYCKTDNQFNLNISKNEIDFWESSGTIITVVTTSKNEVAFISELSGEGDKWLSFHHFVLSADKTMLTDITDAYEKNKLTILSTLPNNVFEVSYKTCVETYA